MWSHLIRCLLVGIIVTKIDGALPPSLRRSIHPVTINRIKSLNFTCDLVGFNVTATMEKPFKGIVFAKDFSQECRAFGTMKSFVTVQLPTSGCGVRLSSVGDDGELYYAVTIVVQQDKHLRQITDQERTVQCRVDVSNFKVKSRPMEEAVKEEILADKKDHRTGRMKNEGWSKDVEEEEEEDDGASDRRELDRKLDDALAAARAWMEIVPVQGSDQGDGTLQVGEEALLMVKSTLPAGIGWKVVDCVAHDGLGDSSQKLLDENGCPVDELLLPEPLKGPVRPIAMMRHQEAVSRFAAFKFPDRDRLHLSCGLQLCREKCQKLDCSKMNSTEARNPRTYSRGDDGELLDRLEVFNSVEVLAPSIELEDLRPFERTESDPLRSPFGYIPGDRTFCVSPNKMALTFCALGLIFLCAVMVAAFALYRARRSGVPMPYYTRSLFSSSSESGSAYGSKLLLHESPCMGQSASVRGYGRIL